MNAKTETKKYKPKTVVFLVNGKTQKRTVKTEREEVELWQEAREKGYTIIRTEPVK